MVFHWRVHPNRNLDFNLSHLCYAVKTYDQYQDAVKLLGSFRLAAGRRHLHLHCIFTGRVFETVPQSLHYSCASELTWQGISLNYSSTLDSIFIRLNFSIKFRMHDAGLSLVMFGLQIHSCIVGSYSMCVIYTVLYNYILKKHFIISPSPSALIL